MTGKLRGFVTTLRQQLPQLAADYGVESLAVFGSYVRSEEGPKSDLDVLVTFKRPVGFIRLVSLENELSDLLGIKIDLVPRNALRPHVAANALREAIPV
jgi:predicted nucleotidyltransferase